MLVTCRNCGVQFNPSAAACLSCGAAAPLEDQRAFLISKAVERLRAGDRPAALREAFIKAGFSDLEADAMLAEANRTWRGSNRRLGGGVLAKGLGLLLVSAVVYAIPLPGGARLAMNGFIAIGLAMTVAGVIMKVTGWNLEREGRRTWADRVLDRQIGP